MSDLFAPGRPHHSAGIQSYEFGRGRLTVDVETPFGSQMQDVWADLQDRFPGVEVRVRNEHRVVTEAYDGRDIVFDGNWPQPR